MLPTATMENWGLDNLNSKNLNFSIFTLKYNKNLKKIFLTLKHFLIGKKKKPQIKPNKKN
jgi:hypothetical protein